MASPVLLYRATVAPIANLVLLDETAPSEVPAAFDSGRVRLAPDAVRDALGWQLEASGLCRGDTCVPVRPEHDLVHAAGVDLAALATLLERPLALDVEERVACLGASAAMRGHRLRSLDAPDFILPDLEGRTHRLSDQRGRKVLLLAWASW